MMLWKILLDMCIFSYYTHYYKKNPENRHTRPVTEDPKLRCTLTPLNEGLVLTNPVFPSTSSTYQKHLKLGQCLEIDDRTPQSKFGDVTWLTLHFADRAVFYRPAFYRLVCKIVNSWDTELRFLVSLSDVDIDNCAKVRRVTIPRCYISKSELFGRGLCRPIIHRPNEFF